ncbi:MAG: DNA polymerase Y family protein [Pseudomonadota bacterium]|nr:MAG: hypothetical protein DIU78_03510 [Pseudomonadota bacterium]
MSDETLPKGLGPLRDRRIAALVLPAFLCELAAPRAAPRSPEKRARAPAPLGVVIGASDEALEATSVLAAVNETARRRGVRPGQTVAEARVFLAQLDVRTVSPAQIERGLGHLAEMALGFGPTVAVSAPDTVWIDITGSAHLFGGEEALAAELVARVRRAGHRGRVAIADGPALAQAFARFGDLGPEGHRVVPSAQATRALGSLPVTALPLPEELSSWLVRIGVLTWADLAALPRSGLVGRLGPHAGRVLELVSGRDDTPLVPYVPERTLIEALSWEEPASGIEPLLFAVRGLVARLSARLSGRGEAAALLLLTVLCDKSIARFRKVPETIELRFPLAKPLFRESDLLRVLVSRLEKAQLSAPTVGLRLEASTLVEAVPRQLELESLLGSTGEAAAEELPLVVSELAADLGDDRVGILALVDSHRPERRSVLERFGEAGVPASKRTGRGSARTRDRSLPIAVKTARPAPEGVGGAPPCGSPTRLLTEPVAFEAPFRAGATVFLERSCYVIAAVRFEARLEAVEWWSRAIHRDYVRLTLRGAAGTFEALAYLDRTTGQRYLQAVLD